MEANYIATATFSLLDKSLSRTIRLPFKTRLDKVALLLFASLVEEEDFDRFVPLFRFGEDIYLFRQDEQDMGYGYSSSSYHVLEEETFFNLLFRHPESGSFEISLPKRQDNLVLGMDLGPISLNEKEEKLSFLDGVGLLKNDGSVLPFSKEEIEKLTKKNLPLLRKAKKYLE